MTLERFILIGGILHLGTLLASALVPRVLDWRGKLAPLDALSRQLIWVHGAFIVLVILGFGLLSIFLAPELASGGRLARGVCGFVAVFWSFRLLIQCFHFDARPYLTNRWLRLGYYGLTLVFTYQAITYSLAAFAR